MGRMKGAWRPLAVLVAVCAIALATSAASVASSVTDTFTGSVDAAGTISKTHKINVTDLSVPIHASLDWTTTSANLNLFLTAPGSSTPVAQATSSSNRPEVVDFQPTVTGTYTLRVKAVTGASAYTLSATYGSGGGGGGSALRYDTVFSFKGPAGLYAYGVEYDQTSDTILVSDYWNYRVKRFNKDTGALLDTFAQGIGAPYDVEVDKAGNVWVAFQEQSVVAEYTQGGAFIRKIGLGGTPNYAKGCGGGKMTIPTHILAHPDGDLWISDPRCRNVYVFDEATGSFKFALNPTLKDLGYGTFVPRGIDVDKDGNVYLVDQSSRRIVEYDSSGNRVKVFPAQTDMLDPRGLNIDQARGFIYVAAAYHNSVYKFSTAGGQALARWDTAGPGGQQFDSVRWAAPDADGNVYVGDTWGHTVWRLTNTGALRSPSNFPDPPQFPPNGGNNQVNGIGINPANNDLFTIDTFENRGQIYHTRDASNNLWYCRAEGQCPSWAGQFGSRKQPSPTSDGFSNPRALTFGDGHIWADGGNGVVELNPDGSFVARFGSKGSGNAQFKSGPKGIWVDPSANLVYTTDSGNCRVLVFNYSGNQVDQLNPNGCGTGTGQMVAPWDLDVDPVNKLVYVADSGRNRIDVWSLNTHSIVRSIAPNVGGTGLARPRGVKLSPDGKSVYIADTDHDRIVRTDLQGGNAQVVSTGADTPEGHFGGPEYLAWDTSGRLYVSDNNQRVYVFSVVG
jgi:DNA-binding beta-propeller fold protein YncE